MKYKTLFVLTLIMLCSVVAVAAKPVEVTHTEVVTDVMHGEVAHYILSITNNQDFNDTFNVVLEDLRFVPTLQPITHLTSGIRVGAGETVTSKLYLVPSDQLRIGEYSISLEATSRKTNTVYRDIIEVYIAPEPVVVELHPDISTVIVMPEKIDPRDDLYIDVQVQNNNALDLENMSLEARSSLFSKTQKMTLGPNGSDTQRFKIELDPFQEPRKDLVTVSISRDNRFVDLVQKDIEVIAYTPPFDKSFSESKSLLKRTKEITLKNNGNIEQTEVIKESLPFYKRWFTKTSPQATKNVHKEFEFAVTLGSQEQAVLQLTTSYRPLLVFLLIVLACWGAYYLSRSPLIVTKSAQVIGRKEGGISRLKVILHVKNRTRQEFDHVRIVDKVQKIAKVLKKKDHLGTIKPTRVARKDGVTLVEWKIPKLDPGEERIITYKIESSLSILGDFRLRKSLVEYHKDGVKGKIYSNEFFIEK